jgi:hypothetical protein
MTTTAEQVDDLTLRDVRDRYFEQNGLGDGGYQARWVRLQAGPIPIVFPNTKERIRSVRLHDLHHPLTGYGTTWTGESEIGAWEIASGCADHVAAWILNLAALAIGVVIAPRATFAAFVRGRHSRNLYREPFDEALLGERVADARRRLGLDRPTPPGAPRDGVAFAGWTALGAVVLALSLLPLAALVAAAAAVLGLVYTAG